jgi:DNA-binding NarL/FixJ family response regulator
MAVGEHCLKGTLRKLAAVRIFIVDDYEPWRRAVRSILQRQEDLEVICEGSDGLEAVQQSAELQPDVVVLDIGLPNLGGLEAARQIRKVSPGSKILFLTMQDSPEVVREALMIGALGFVVKLDAVSDLLLAVNTVMRNQRFVPRRLSPMPWMIQEG